MKTIATLLILGGLTGLSADAAAEDASRARAADARADHHDLRDLSLLESLTDRHARAVAHGQRATLAVIDRQVRQLLVAEVGEPADTVRQAVGVARADRREIRGARPDARRKSTIGDRHREIQRRWIRLGDAGDHVAQGFLLLELEQLARDDREAARHRNGDGRSEAPR